MSNTKFCPSHIWRTVKGWGVIVGLSRCMICDELLTTAQLEEATCDELFSTAHPKEEELDEARHDDEAYPGSPLAVSRGCTCPVLDNNNGQGHLRGGEQYFWKVEDCPLHGRDLRSGQEEAGDA